MAEVIWSREALRCMSRIGRYIEERRPRTAAKWVRKLSAAPDVLEKLPHRGSIVEEFNFPNLRELIVKPYRILYRLDEDIVTVLLVLHSSQNVFDYFDDEDFTAS